MLGTRTSYDTVRTEAELRKIMGTPSGLVVGKQLDRLDRHCRAFVALSPFVLVGTCDSSGACGKNIYKPMAAEQWQGDKKVTVWPEAPAPAKYPTPPWNQR
jgi:predicted pyridoxine 5'-phosphate oxidase superfamily flavin-nucleotide-binding protein